MDDGKCLLDVISDPQALKEFFRSTSQIAFVEGNVPPVSNESDNNKPDTSKAISRSDITSFTTRNVQTSNSSKQASSGPSNQQTKPLAHFSFPTTSSNVQSNFLTNTASSITNGLQNITVSNLRGTSVSINIPNLQTSASSTENVTTLVSNNQPTIVTSRSMHGQNVPVLFEPGKARNILSTGSISLSNVEKAVAVSPKQTINQSQNLTTTPRFISNPNTTIRPQNLKSSPLPTLRPKGISQQPQNASSPRLGEQRNSQLSIQGNILPQGLKAKSTTPLKGQQQLVAIRPKVVIAQPNATGSGLASQKSLGNSTTRPKQTLQSGFTLGATVQAKQLLNTLTVPQLKVGGSNQPVGKSSLASLVQLQPKTIAPKPEVSTVQTAGKVTLVQEQAHLQLVQGLLAQTQAKFGGVQVQKDVKQTTSLSQETVAQQQQNQLKKLLQQNQLAQQAMQSRVQPQQHTTQSMPSIQIKSPPATATLVTQQQKLPANQTTFTANLASQLKEAINSKQLHQFLEKNPLVAQQLKQLNMRQANLATMSTTGAATVKTATQQPATTLNQLSKPVTQLQQASKLQKAAPGVTPLQKPITSISLVQKPATTVSQLTKPVVTHVTIPAPKKVTNTVVQVAQPEQKPITTQKVVIVQQSGATTAVNSAQTKVLLQTKEGRPILLSQEQFRQIQAQLASKNLSIQGKLVTATPATTTATTAVKPQVVVKSSDSTPTKASQKVLPATSKPQMKQETTKSAKRPIKAVETPESKLIKRMKLSMQKDQNDVCFTDIHKPFKTHQDAIKRLTPYHVYSEPIPNAKMEHKANMLLDKLALQLTHKSDKMINKYRQLLLGDMQRDVPSAELVMVNRIFLANEKASLMKEKKAVLEEAKQMAQSARTTLSEINTSTNQSSNNATTTTTVNQLSTLSTDQTNSNPETTEHTHIEISDDDSSPMTSATSFLTHISTAKTDYSVINRTLEPG